MQISLDTNIWIFGIVGADEFCEKILYHLAEFEVAVPDQVRAELERNLSNQDMKQFYQFVFQADVQIDFDKVSSNYIAEFEQKGRC